MKLVKYAKDNCPQCKFLDVLANANGVVFDEVVMLDGQPEKARSLGIMSVPVVVLYDGDKEIERMAPPTVDQLMAMSQRKSLGGIL